MGTIRAPERVTSGGGSRVALCLADLHSNVTALQRVDALLGLLARELSVVLLAGDVTIPGHEAYAEDVIAVVQRHNVPLLLVHGNNDTAAAVEAFRRAGVTIHRQERQVAGDRFVGFGGDGTVPHDTELGPGESLALDLSNAILLTHLPPPGVRYAAQDDGPPPNPQAGTRSVVPLRQEALPDASRPPGTSRKTSAAPATRPTFPSPRAHICGHIHHTEGVARVGPTKIVKLRAAMWNRCALLDLDTLVATFRDLAPGAPCSSRG